MKTPPDKITRDPRLDYVKAISICLVLILHLHFIQVKTNMTSNAIERFISFSIKQFTSQVTLIAVPTFLLTSLFLLFKKMEKSAYILRRLRRMLGVFLFWTVCQFAAYYLFDTYKSLRHGKAFSFHLPDISFLRLLAEGGPPLPLVGSSVFYFLFVLIILSVFAYLFFKFKKYKITTYIEILLVIVSLIIFEVKNLKASGYSYWKIENFLIYIPLAHFSLKHTIPSRYLFFLYLGFFLFSCQDFIIRKTGYPMGGYAKISVVFGSMALFHTLLNLKANRTPSKVIYFLSTFSLGIFALHKYWQLFTLQVAPKIYFLSHLPSDFAMGGLIVDLKILVMSIFTVCFTILSVVILNRTPIRKFIR